LTVLETSTGVLGKRLPTHPVMHELPTLALTVVEMLRLREARGGARSPAQLAACSG
jgi:hypothetical protein